MLSQPTAWPEKSNTAAATLRMPGVRSEDGSRS
jgi:hypothetical protein